MLGFILSNSGKEPIYNQIYNNIKHQILSDQLSGKLPSIRELARDLGVSVITTKKAYEKLEGDRFIRATPGLGYFVIFDVANSAKHRKDTLINKIQDIGKQFIASGGTGLELKSIFKYLMEETDET